jgi:hypothetical protein
MASYKKSKTLAVIVPDIAIVSIIKEQNGEAASDLHSGNNIF